jgi:UDP-N-acetylmuramate dehydrogenase
MRIHEDVDLSKLSYMKIGGTGQFLVEVEKEFEIKDLHAFIKEKNLPVVFLGSGSNTIFSDEYHKKIFVKFLTKDIIKTYEDEDSINLKVSTGLNWDDFVKWSVENNLSGIECLSSIPGTVGAAPIQNIGAYGQEVEDVIINVDVYELETEKFYEISNIDCNFSYRDSIFKQNKGKFIITNVGFKLFKKEPKSPTYKDLSLYFLAQQKKNTDLKEIRDAVVEIRRQKLPDWKKEPNCGSFFKNPIVSNEKASELIKKYPDMPQFNAGEGYTKISGGWLIEKCNLKGKDFGGIKIHPKSGLVLINTGKGNFKKLIETIKKIRGEIKNKFDIELEIEPNLIK